MPSRLRSDYRIKPRSVRQSLCLILLLILSLGVTLSTTDANAQERRSTGWAYASASAGFLIPAWTAQMLISPDDEGPTWNARWVAAATGYYTSLSWGTSAGYYYSGNRTYATWSGLGKTALLGAGVAAQLGLNRSGRDHPYIFATAILATLTWDIGDFIYLYRDVDTQNRKRSALVHVPIALQSTGLFPPGLFPSLVASRDSWSVSIGGGF